MSFKKILIILIILGLGIGIFIGIKRNTKEVPKPIVETPDKASKEVSVSSNKISNENQTDPAFEGLDLSDVKDLNSLTLEDIKTLPIDDIKKIIAVNTTDFRLTYGIPRDTEMTDTEWEKIRFLLCYQLYGKEGLADYLNGASPEALSALEYYNEITDDLGLTEDERKHLMPLSSEIEALTLDEFRTFLKETSVYYDNEEYSYSKADYDSLTNEDLAKMKSYYVNALKENEKQYSE